MSTCYDYFSLDELFSGFENPVPFQQSANQSNTIVSLMSELQQAFDNLVNSPNAANTQNFMSLTAQIQAMKNTSQSINSNYTVRTVPNTCANSSSCQYICDNFLSVHGLNSCELVSPGINYQGSAPNARILEAAYVGVVYSDSGYNITNVSSGAEDNVDFSTDPASTANNFNNGTSGSFAVANALNWTMMVLMVLAFLMM